MVFVFDGFCTLIIGKLNSVRDEISKRERIIREAGIPRVCGEKVLKRVPVSFDVVKNFLRRGRSIQVGDKVM